MTVKNVRFRSDEITAARDKLVLEMYKNGEITAKDCMAKLSIHNDGITVFDDVVHFVEWANGMGYRKFVESPC